MTGTASRANPSKGFKPQKKHLTFFMIVPAFREKDINVVQPTGDQSQAGLPSRCGAGGGGTGDGGCEGCSHGLEFRLATVACDQELSKNRCLLFTVVCGMEGRFVLIWSIVQMCCVRRREDEIE